jgi:hypothetical protein
MILQSTESVTSNKDNTDRSIIVKCGGEYGVSFNDC